jgi:hypothetical protein
MAARRRLRVRRELEEDEELEEKQREDRGEEKQAAEEPKETPGPLKHVDDLGRLGVRQRADAMHDLQKRVGNQAVAEELEFERDVFPHLYMQHRHELKRELQFRLWITEDRPVVGELPEAWRKWRAQRREQAWWDCLLDKPNGKEKREFVTLAEALREIAAFQQLGIPCPPFDELLERERRRYLAGKRLTPA